MGVAVLGGCGFEPVYGTRPETAATMGVDLASIRLPDAVTTVEYTLRNALLDQLNPTRASIAERYRLEWRLRRQVQNLAIQLDGVVTRQDYTLAATYALVDVTEGQVVDRGRIERTASFNIRREPFSDRVAREDAERRAAEAVAIALRQHLVAHFERSAA